MMMTPGGLGPWFNALLFNTRTDSKKQTHLIAHTLPHLACDMLNRNGMASGDSWIIMLKVGPFSDWSVCLAFLEQWMSRKRGKQRRLERGIELFAMYREAYDLVLWSQTRKEPLLAEAMDIDEDDHEDAEEIPLPERQRTVPDEQPLANVRRSFEAESALTIHGLVGICARFQMSMK